MKRLALIAVLTLTTMVSTLAPAYAQTSPGLAIPVVSTSTAAVFNGTFTLKRFVPTADGVAAVGTLSGIATPAGGTPMSVFGNVTIPAQVVSGAAPVAARFEAAVAPCPILHLDLGPLFLDLLGVEIDLSRVVLDISAQPGSGNLLGNLLCAITGLLDQPGGLSFLLNRILGILG